MTDRIKPSWHMDRTVNISHIAITVSIIVSVVMYNNTLDKRIAANTQSISYVKEQREEDGRRIEKRLDSINSKLDKLLESQIIGHY
tara:strand:- start:176215 stop:176472 length:258 start_codon:yes stop_codon:yes gene_type:complete